MIQSLTSQTPIDLLARVAAFAERRHEVLAGNMANVSTPDYHTRDLPVGKFDAALAQAARRLAQTGAPPTSLSAAHRLGLPPGSLSEQLTLPPDPAPTDALADADLYRPEQTERSLQFQDGNDRSIELEVLEMTKNSMRHTMAIELMNSYFTRLQTVISERV